MMSNRVDDTFMDIAEFQKLANENEDLKHKMKLNEEVLST